MRVIFLLMQLCLVLTACALNVSPAPAACVARIGVVNSNSGTFAESGRDLLRGYEMAREEINARGELSGCTVELDVRDDASDAAQAKRVARELLNEPLVAVMGATNTDLTMPVAQLADAKQIPLVVPTASNDVLTAAFAYTVRIAASQSQVVGAQFELLDTLVTQGTPVRSVGVLYENSESGRGIFYAVQRAAHDHAIALTAVENYAQGATDWKDQLARIQRAQPDVLYLDTNRLRDAGALLEQVKAAGLAPKIIFVSTLSSALQTDARAQNLLTSVQWLPSLDWRDENGTSAQDWARAYETRFGAPPAPRSAAAYQAVRVIVRALKQTEATPDALANPNTLHAALLRALYQTRVNDSIYGALVMDDFGQNAHPVLIAQVVNGALCVVHPEAYRTCELVLSDASKAK